MLVDRRELWELEGSPGEELVDDFGVRNDKDVVAKGEGEEVEGTELAGEPASKERAGTKEESQIL